ncbi:MAG: hypothetical protein AB1489_35155 [Acidobacteriota bacterium]
MPSCVQFTTIGDVVSVAVTLVTTGAAGPVPLLVVALAVTE